MMYRYFTIINSHKQYPDFINDLTGRENILTDTTSHLEKSDFRDYKSNIYSGRINRWQYSRVVFKDSMSIPQKIFGGGFNYLEMFGEEFGEKKYDYPHNTFISAFLYSGIVGGFFYIWFMFLVFYYYIKYYKYHVYFFICFLVVFYFSFFSGNTIFSIPIFAIISIIPFHTRYLIEKDKKEVEIKWL